MRILFAEKDLCTCSSIVKGLRTASFAVDIAGDGVEALNKIYTSEYDALILNVDIPFKNGLEVCRELRMNGVGVPVLLLSGPNTVKERVQGLDAGADDYLTRPFAYEEFLARVRALLRRSDKKFLGPSIKVGALEVDTWSQRVWHDGNEILLTSKEFAVLEYFARNADRVIGREELSEHCWDETYDPFSNSIEVFVNRLRKKIGRSRRRSLIQTRRGAGYVLRTTKSKNVFQDQTEHALMSGRES